MPAQEGIYHILGVMFSCHYFPLTGDHRPHRDYGFSFEASKMCYFQQSAPNSEQQEQRFSPHMENHCTTLAVPHLTVWKSVHQQKVFPRLNEIQGFWTLEKPFFYACSISWRHLNRYQQINGSGCLILEAASAGEVILAELHCSGVVLLLTSWVLWRGLEIAHSCQQHRAFGLSILNP